MLKRTLDLLLAIALLLVNLPVLLLAAALVRWDSPGPVIHRARRVGKDGKLFTLYKFRTMVVDAASQGPGITRPRDPRITRVGRLLRRSKVDELPQLLNVLKGEMSMIGPRPEDPRFVAHYTSEQRHVLAVRPGIASPASVKYFDEDTALVSTEADVEAFYLRAVLPDKLRIDLNYVQQQSPLQDLRVLAQAAIAFLTPRREPVTLPVPHLLAAPSADSAPTAHRAFSYVLLPLLLDVAIVVVSLLLSWEARSITARLGIGPALAFVAIVVAVYCSANALFLLYHRLWRYASLGDAVYIYGATVIATGLLTVVELFWPGERPVPLSVVPMTGFFAFPGFLVARYGERMWSCLRWRWQSMRDDRANPRTRVLVVGAGEAGRVLAWRFQNQRQAERYHVVGFVDDDPAKHGLRIHGVAVRGNRHAIPRLIDRFQADLIVIAINKLAGPDFREIVDICQRTTAAIKVLPSFSEFMHSRTHTSPIRSITAEDLLGRRSAEIDADACRGLVAGKTVLVTGGAGSIGSELCRQILPFAPRQLLILDNNESGLYDLVISLRGSGSIGSASDPASEPTLMPIIADITHTVSMQAVFDQHRPQVVFHAAAYKHVPLMEEHPDQAVRVNIRGTCLVAYQAARSGCEVFVFVSTDKAVNPSCVMGATKRLGEAWITSGAPNVETLISSGANGANGSNGSNGSNSSSSSSGSNSSNGSNGSNGSSASVAPSGKQRTLFTAVRFGNVLGSRGSVVPTFERQIELGGPVTVTHPEMTRYFMSVSEAASLVIQAGALTEGGDVFMLEMGQRIRIDDLARRLIRLRGLRPDVDISVVYTGTRPGEKLHEQLLAEGELRSPTAHPLIFRVTPSAALDREVLLRHIDRLLTLGPNARKEEIAASLLRYATWRPGSSPLVFPAPTTNGKHNGNGKPNGVHPVTPPQTELVLQHDAPDANGHTEPLDATHAKLREAAILEELLLG